MKKETYLAQLGNNKDDETGSISLPIHLSTAYKHLGLGRSTGYDYTRTKNPTRDVLQEGLAELEGGKFAFATSSGMAAIQLVLQIFYEKPKFLVHRDLYGGTYRYFKDLEKKNKASFTYFSDEEDLEEKIDDSYQAVFLESLTNPLLNIMDIKHISEKAKSHGLLTVVDNTLLTPKNCHPLEDGADIVIHSVTKYLAGHNDILAGAVICNDEKVAEELAFQLNTQGMTLDPFDSWLTIRSLKTFSIRFERQEENANKIARALEESGCFKEIIYPGKSAMLSIKLKDEGDIGDFLDRLKIFSFAESLGGVESLITYPRTQTHADIPDDLRHSYGLTDDLLRLSIGIEDVDDLIEDLLGAIRK